MPQPNRRLRPSEAARWFRALGPLAKLGVWAASLILLVALLEATTIATGMPVSVLEKNAGGAILLVLALVTLLAMIITERRPLAAYGLVIPDDWRRQAFKAAAIGAAFYLTYLTLCVALGGCHIRLDGITAARAGKSLLAAASAAPVAAVQQIIFAGLLLGMLRQATSRWTAVLLPAFVFGAFAAAAKLQTTSPLVAARLLVGLTLVATLLGLLRLRTGSIVFPAGLLAGVIASRKVLAKLRLLDFDPFAEASPWISPSGDPRQAPLFWCLLLLAIAGVAVITKRYGERTVTTDPDAAASFKRVMPFSNLLAFAPLDRWLVELARAQFRVQLAYLPRLVFTLIASALTTIVTLPERILAARLLWHDVPPPVFIVGMHRSGTTHLHNLLALDPQFRSPRNFEVFNPHGFLTGWLTTAAMAPLLMWRRPMDAVQMTVFSTQEEEFALAAMGGESPYWMFPFPRRTRELQRFWHTNRFSPRERTRWQHHYRVLLRKLTWLSRRRPLLKNPVNTSRVAPLAALFPGAQFVYIVRHPYAVYQSNQHFAEQGFAVFQLQTADSSDNYATQFLHQYRAATDACERDLATLAPGAAARLQFEDLEADPVAVIESIYQQLGLELSAEYRRRLQQYLTESGDYQKNRFASLTTDERQQVDAAMGSYLVEWGYASRDVREAA